MATESVQSDSLRTGRSASDVSTIKSGRHHNKGDISSRSSDFGDKISVDNYEKLSPLHESLVEALSASQVLQAVHIEVKNESYWYHMRKRMGPKKHMALIVKYNTTSLRWESFIFKMKLRDEDMEVVPKKTIVGNYKTKWAAYKAAEAAAKERDMNPAKNKKLADIMPAEKIMSTHFRILVVSDRFHHLNIVQRHRLVYEELIKAIGVNIAPMDDPLGINGTAEDQHNCKKGLGTSAPERLRLGSVYGNRMCSLDLFRFLLPDDHTPLTLMVDTRTPSQWRPEVYKPPLSERLGAAHNDLRALQITGAAQPKSHQSRVKKLTTVVNHEMLHQLELQQHHVGGPASTALRQSQSAKHVGTSGHSVHSTHSASGDDESTQSSLVNTYRTTSAGDNKTAEWMDSLGLDAAVSGVKYKKLGGIYGHFFNDLSPEIREMVMSKYKDNKHLIRDEGNLEILQLIAQQKKERQTEDTNQPRTNISMMRAKQQAAAVSGEYDKGTASEHEMMEEVNISNLRMNRAAIRLQRVRRMYIWHRAVKQHWWHHYAALTIQRCLRAHFGRQYVQLYRSLRPRAAVRIQRCYRTAQSRVLLRIWQWMVYQMTRIVLPKIKRFIRNCFLSWLRRRDVYAIKIQSIVRGFVGRARCFKKLGERHFFRVVFPKAALLIQKVIRGFMGRCAMKVHLEKVLHAHIVIPAAIRLQRIYRGRLGKLELARLRVRAAAVATLQKHIRIFVHRMWAQQMHTELVRKRSATKIQRVYRGTLDRQLYRMKAHIRWYNTKYIPAIILVQSVVRRFRAVRYVHGILSKNRAVIKIQTAYANYCARKLAKAVTRDLRKMREFRAVSNIQRYVRRRLAIVAYRRKKLEYNGRITMAAKVIMRAWTNYLLSRRYKHLLDEHRRKAYLRRIEKYVENRLDVHEDVKEIRVDIALATRAIERLKERIKLVEEFRAQASIRQGKVKIEMSELKVEDFERGIYFNFDWCCICC